MMARHLRNAVHARFRTPCAAFAHPARVLAIAACVFASAAICGVAHAGDGDYPSRPITIMVPNGAGGSIDLVTRAIAERLEVRFGQPVVIENRSGASGVIGAGIVRAAKADGYLLLASSSSTNTIVPHA